MAKLSKEELTEKLKSMSKEDRTLFREALSEAEPEMGLLPDEVLQIREVLRSAKESKSTMTKKPKNIFEAIFGAE